MICSKKMCVSFWILEHPSGGKVLSGALRYLFTGLYFEVDSELP